MKVAIYTRVSTLEQKEKGYSLEEQRSMLVDYCRLKEWTIYDVYSDGGNSGANIERPGLKKLLLHAGQKKFDAVIVWKLDRLSRSQKDTLYIIEDVFLDNDIEFVSFKENFDTATTFGKAVIGMLAVFAQLEREQMAERFMMGKIGRAKAGLPMSWTNLTKTFGYDLVDDRYVINPVEAETVKNIFKEYLAGKSITALVKKYQLNGKKVHHSTIRRILFNPTYAGKIRFKEEVYDGQHEAIISEEMFNRTQQQLAIRQQKAYERNKTRPFKSKYMLSGLVYCPCGHRMGIAFERDKTIYYACVTRLSTYRRRHGLKEACEMKKYYLEDLEKHVLEEIEKLRLDPAIKPEQPEKVDTSIYYDEVEKIDRKLERLLDLYLDSNMSRFQLDERQQQLNNHKQMILATLEHEQSKYEQDGKAYLMEDLSGLLQSVHDVPYEKQKELANKLIDRVVPVDDEVTITWNF